MWPYPWTHVGTPSHLGHMDRVAATMPSQAHAGAAQEAPDIGQWKGQDVPLVRPSSCKVKGGIPRCRRYLPTYLPVLGNSWRARNMSRGALPRPRVRNSSGGRLGAPHTPVPGRPGSGAVQPHRVPQGGPCPTTVPAGQHRHAAHRQTATPRHVPPDGATHNAVAWAPRATPPLLRQRRPVADGGAGMPQPMRR